MASVAIVGGGINGLCIAWQLLQRGFQVELFEREQLMSATSRASSKLLHGGLRYLEQGHWRLVRSSLRERAWWLKRVPELTRPLPMLLPLYQHQQRSRLTIALGLSCYRALAGWDELSLWSWLSAKQTLQLEPQLQPRGLLGAFQFFEGQMDDYRLGLWVAEQVRQLGGLIHNQQQVESVSSYGLLQLATGPRQFDLIINATGPWAQQLLERSGLRSPCQLQALRGSHLLLQGLPQQALLLAVPESTRIFFVLPYQGQTLVGTTEVVQSLAEPIRCSQAETEQLLAAYQHYLSGPVELLGSFAGIRPLIQSDRNPSRASREHLFDFQQRLVSVFGGKWTTAHALATELVVQIRHRYPRLCS